MIEGSGSVSLTNGSGYGRSKNIWILRIWIRNTADPQSVWIQSALILVGWIRSQEGKNDPQKGKKFRNFKFWSASRCSLLRAEGLSCSLDVLYEGLGISETQLIKKNTKLFSAVIFFIIFGHQNSGYRLNPDPESVNPEPKHWFMLFKN